MSDKRDLFKGVEVCEEDYDEPRYFLDEDSICYGCQYYIGEEDGEDICETPEPCFEGNMNGYRAEIVQSIYGWLIYLGVDIK